MTPHITTTTKSVTHGDRANQNMYSIEAYRADQKMHSLGVDQNTLIMESIVKRPFSYIVDRSVSNHSLFLLC